jgi:hypothetical protein
MISAVISVLNYSYLVQILEFFDHRVWLMTYILDWLYNFQYVFCSIHLTHCIRSYPTTLNLWITLKTEESVVAYKAFYIVKNSLAKIYENP